MLGHKKIRKQLNGRLGIGELLREIRHQKGFTLNDVAVKTGFSEETIRRLELDKFEPKLSTLELLSDFYRIDLIELIARKRAYNSLFSEELISEIHNLINTFDVAQLISYADERIATLQNSKDKGSEVLIKLLYALKNLKMNPKGSSTATIANLEQVLVSISSHYYTEKSPDFPIAIEVSCILYLAYVYRQAGDFDKAISLLEATHARIKQLPIINDRFSDYLAATAINLANVYYSLNKPQKVIETVDACLDDTATSYTRIAISQLLYRKGLALYEIGLPQGKAHLITALSLMRDAEAARLRDYLRNNYKLDL